MKPVFVRTGTIIPMDGAEELKNGCPLPERLTMRIFAGKDGECRLLENNGKRPGSEGYRKCETVCRILGQPAGTAEGKTDIGEGNGLQLILEAAEGDLSLLPGNRVSEMEIVGIGNHLPDEASCGYEAVYEPETRTMRLTLDVKPGESASIRWNRYPVPEELSVDKKLLDLLLPVRMANMDKDRMLETAKTIKDPVRRMASWMTCDLPEGLPGALAEMEAIR